MQAATPTYRAPTSRHVRKSGAPGCKREIVFEHRWRDDFIGEALTVGIDSELRIRRIEFYHADLGVARWTAETGLFLASVWSDGSKVDRKDQTQRVVESVLEPFEEDLAGFVRVQLQYSGHGLRLPASLVGVLGT